MDATDQASRKPQKLQGDDDEEIVAPSSDDRLSSLPDSVLCHILSFLETKFSVATSILARRWRFLWNGVPNLEFGNDFFSEHREKKFRCAKIINRVMLLQNVRNINAFCICHYDNVFSNEYFSYNDLVTWLRTAIARNVQILDLAVWGYDLPTCIYTCKTLVELSLCGVTLRRRPVCLPHLRKLHLDSVVYSNYNDTTLSDLIYGCPVLEELTIEDCDAHSSLHGKISSTTIKQLALVLTAHEEEGDYSPRELEINIPGLRYLYFEQDEEFFFEHFTAATLNDIVEANVWLGNSWVRDDVLYSQSVIHFVERLCRVKSLQLSSQFTKFLDTDIAAATSRFHKLTKLELAADWRFLIKFLECADNLEVLIINKS